jgi:probable F420-dependent oxidoreductase
MRIGVIFPQLDLGGDVAAVRAYGQGVEQLGFSHVLAYDHVLGSDPEVHAPWNGPYDIDTTCHEPLVMFGYLAGVTQLELVTGILILPQRPTALVAKQAAEVDLLTGGRFRLGVGIGWNKVEYDALGKDFTDRGRRLDEQVALLRRLWTERSVTMDGRFEHVTGAGLSPAPIQRPIPVWCGGASEPAYRRIGRLADGWFPMVPPGDQLEAARATIAASAAEAGRDISTLGMEGRVLWQADDPDRFRRQVERWRAAGATHLGIDTMRLGLEGVDAHLSALEAVARLLELSPA